MAFLNTALQAAPASATAPEACPDQAAKASQPQAQTRAQAALQLMFVADALAMPVHWFYRVGDIYACFPQGIQRFEAAPQRHPGAIMSLHSTSTGGRAVQAGVQAAEVVGQCILKDKRAYWNRPEVHYHQGMPAGENTLNAYCAQLLLRHLIKHAGQYSSRGFAQDYVDFMTAEPAQHPDTYAESYHRSFFAQWQTGLPPHRCAQTNHDTDSIGGLVTLAPLALYLAISGQPLRHAQALCREHLWLTHPSETLADYAQALVGLIYALVFRTDTPARSLIAAVAQHTGLPNLPALAAQTQDDNQLVGGRFSRACYIQDAWPSVLYLAYQYAERPLEGLLSNTHLGGDNCHRGAVLGVLLGLACADGLDDWFTQLRQHSALNEQITQLLAQCPPLA
jgi:ADP-ribosylglycohydrolase